MAVALKWPDLLSDPKTLDTIISETSRRTKTKWETNNDNGIKSAETFATFLFQKH